MSSDWVMRAHAGCIRDRCQFSQAAGLLAAARQIVEQGRLNRMSQALWCDQGGHAFSERDPGRQRISITVLDEESGEERAEARDFCGACAEASGLLSKRKTRPATVTTALPAGPHPDPQRIAQLEHDLGMDTPNGN